MRCFVFDLHKEWDHLGMCSFDFPLVFLGGFLYGSGRMLLRVCFCLGLPKSRGKNPTPRHPAQQELFALWLPIFNRQNRVSLRKDTTRPCASPVFAWIRLDPTCFFPLRRGPGRGAAAAAGAAAGAPWLGMGVLRTPSVSEPKLRENMGMVQNNRRGQQVLVFGSIYSGSNMDTHV